MAAKKKAGKGSDVIKLTKDDFKRKTFKTAPGGTYTVRLTKKTVIAPGTDGNVLKVHGQVSRGNHKGVTFFDNIAPHVGWKIAQLLTALGVKKMQLTLQALLKLVKEHGEEIRVQLREKKFEGKRRNEVVMYLPPGKGSTDDEDEDQDEDADDVSDEDEDEDETEEEDADEESDEDEEEESDDEESDDDEDSDDEEDEEDDDSEDDDDVEEDDDESDDDEESDEDDEEAGDEDEDEEEEEPASKRRAVKKKAAPKRRATPAAKKKTAPRRKK
jgi:hypothetical protein